MNLNCYLFEKIIYYYKRYEKEEVLENFPAVNFRIGFFDLRWTGLFLIEKLPFR